MIEGEGDAVLFSVDQEGLSNRLPLSEQTVEISGRTFQAEGRERCKGPGVGSHLASE